MTTLFVRVSGPAERLEAADDALSGLEAGLDGAPAAASYDLQAQWLISESDGDVRAQGEADLRGLSELIDPETDWLQNPANVVLIIPAGLVLDITCEVPGRNAAQVRRALPFAVEEYVATDIEAMHVAAGAFSRGGSIRSQVIERSLLNDWIGALRSVGIRPGYALSDAELLQGSNGRATLLFDGDEVLLKNQQSAACIDSENLEFVLGQFIDAAGEEAVIETVNGEVDPLSIAQLPPDVEFTTTHLEADQTVLGYLAGEWQERGPLADNAINLLQGEYSVRMNAGGGESPWRMVGMLAAAWFGIALLALGAKGFYSDGEAERLNSETVALYKDIYPDTRRVPPNIKRDVEFRMGGSSVVAAQFIPLMARLSNHLTPAMKVRSFNFQGSRDELSTELILSGFDALDALKDDLSGDGLGVEISSADQQSDGVHARLRLRASGQGGR